jgi:hypothetical protein
LPFADGRLTTDPFLYGFEVVGGGAMEVIVTEPTT